MPIRWLIGSAPRTRETLLLRLLGSGRLLRARFGELPADALARIAAAEVDELERWGERVLAAQSLAEVVG